MTGVRGCLALPKRFGLPGLRAYAGHADFQNIGWALPFTMADEMFFWWLENYEGELLMTLSMHVLAAFAFAHFLAAASPGPNFFLVTSITISISRFHGVLAALGILASMLVWSTSAALGLSVFLESHTFVSSALRYAGAAYLIWMGTRLIYGAMHPRVPVGIEKIAQTSMSGASAFWRGVTVNITNPKTVAYYTSIFAVLVPGSASIAAMAEIVATAVLVSAVWWLSVALLFSNPRVSRLFAKTKRAIDFFAGGAFVLFGVRIATR